MAVQEAHTRATDLFGPQDVDRTERDAREIRMRELGIRPAADPFRPLPHDPVPERSAWLAFLFRLFRWRV
jgi:hypothetical protein